MKFLKWILIVVGSLIVLVLITALFVQKKYAVEREIAINKPVSKVFEYVVMLRNQDDFSAWANMDADMKKEFKGLDGTVGFISAWSSENKEVGKGEQEIMAIDPRSRIDYELRFLEPFAATDKAYITTEAVNDSATVVRWGFNGEMKYPSNLMLLFMDMEKMLGNDLTTGLTKLKEIQEMN